MRSYFDTLTYFETLLSSDELVNTVTSGVRSEIDHYKKNIFPIANILILRSPPNPNNDQTAVTRYDVEVTALDIRDNNKEYSLDKVWYNDNRQDNWNRTRAILKFLHNRLIKVEDDDQISLVSASECLRIDNEFANNLDGWTQTFTIDIWDQYTKVC